MKNLRRRLMLLGLVALGGTAVAGEMHSPHANSKEFEQMKTLAGTWKGHSTGPGDKNTQDVTVEYRLTSGGSVVMETLFPGTPHEMVTMYYDQDGKLGVTHYCSMGNQPHMTLMKSDGKTLDFSLAKGGHINPSKDDHMHALSLTFSAKDHLQAVWTQFKDGKESSRATFILARVSPSNGTGAPASPDADADKDAVNQGKASSGSEKQQDSSQSNSSAPAAGPVAQ